MTSPYEFFVPGYPMPAPRMTQRSKFTKRNQKYLAYKALIGWSARQVIHTPFDANTRVSVDLEFFRTPSCKGDVDNLSKSILDGMNKIAYEDDQQVKELHALLTDCEEKSDEGVKVKVMELSARGLV